MVIESGGHHADNSDARAGRCYWTSDDARIRAETTMPQSVTQDHDELATQSFIVLQQGTSSAGVTPLVGKKLAVTTARGTRSGTSSLLVRIIPL